MKKLFFIFIFFCFRTVVCAQFNVGLNAIGQLPQGEYKKLSDFGYGGSASVGYIFAQRIDLSFVYSIYNYKSMINSFRLNSKTANAQFLFWKGNTHPYLGCGVGIFTEILDSPPIPKQTENSWGFEPKAGILINSEFIKKLHVDIAASWLRADLTQRGPNAINLSIGLKYYINFYQKNK